MKRVILNIVFLNILLVSIGCSHNRKNTVSNDSNTTVSVTKNVIALNLTVTQSYCGGAPPTETYLADLQTPKKLVATKIYVREGSSNDWSEAIVAEGTSDANGVVLLELKDGTYSVVFENKMKSTYDQLVLTYGFPTANRGVIDTVCLKEYMLQPEAIITVSNGKTSSVVMVNKNEPCESKSVPCAEYTGPLPQSTLPRK